ncbi:MAG TPA: XRE family transcriptional regulator [Planctomycetota bacterium]|nr:XRE family transcriptional regulator [Planctomycetota bacterium]
MSRFGDLVKRLRKDRSMTLEQVARKIQSHKGYVSGIENGKVNPPSVKFIRKFARIFQYDEKQMVRMAYVDKAPKLIREEANVILERSGVALSGAGGVPLLNTVATGYPVERNGHGLPKPLVDATLSLPDLGVQPSCAVTVCDNSMEAPDGFSIAKGDVILLASEPRLKHGSIVFAVFKSKDKASAVVRQVMLEQNDHVILQPLNKEFPLEFLAQDDIEAIYRVVGRIEVYRDLVVDAKV